MKMQFLIFCLLLLNGANIVSYPDKKVSAEKSNPSKPNMPKTLSYRLSAGSAFLAETEASNQVKNDKCKNLKARMCVFDATYNFNDIATIDSKGQIAVEYAKLTASMLRVVQQGKLRCNHEGCNNTCSILKSFVPDNLSHFMWPPLSEQMHSNK